MEVKMDVNNKVAVITGGLGGIGFKTVRYLLKNGVGYVAIFDLLKSENAKVLESLGQLEKEFDTTKFGYFSCDVTNTDEFKATFDKVVELKKQVEILINNAGILNDLDVEMSINVNHKAVVAGTLMAIEHMRIDKGAGKGGVVVNIGSTAGLQNFPITAVYNSTKHAVVSFVRSLKEFNKKLGVRVVCLCPGFTDTLLVDTDRLKKSMLDFVDDVLLDNLLKEVHRQKPESIALAVVEIIKKGDDGAVWVARKDNYPEGVNEIDEVSELRYQLT